MELGSKDLWDLHCGEDAREVEDYGVRHSGDNNAWVREQRKGGEEVLERDRFGANLPKVEILPLERGLRARGLDLVSNVESFRGKEEVEDELHPVRYGEDPVDPLPAVGVEGQRTP